MKLNFDLSFFPMIIFITLLGNIKYFFWIYIFVFIHEISHVITAKIFGLKVDKIILTGFGANAQIINFNHTSAKNKFFILMSGPVSNLFLYIVIKLFCPNNFCELANIYIFIFNLLPLYPLDGGKIFLLVLKKRFGLAVNTLFIKFNRVMNIVVIFFGLVQFFFVHNFSLCIIGFYLVFINKKSFLNLILDLYLY